jgi:hypothetical protein
MCKDFKIHPSLPTQAIYMYSIGTKCSVYRMLQRRMHTHLIKNHSLKNILNTFLGLLSDNGPHKWHVSLVMYPSTHRCMSISAEVNALYFLNTD